MKRKPIRWILVTTAAMTMVVAGCGHKAAPAGNMPAASVHIHTFMFAPNPVAVRAGTSVTWTNDDDILHTVTSGTRDQPNGAFNTQLNGVGKSFTTTFRTPGVYHYFCSRHPGMDAEVDVS